MLDAQVIWDLPEDPGGNVQHVAEHGFTPDDIEFVLLGGGTVATSRSSGKQLTSGYTPSRQFVCVVWEHVSHSPLTMRPITAYEVPEPVRPQRRRRKRRGT